jgi:hypothetical protein
MSIGYAIHLEKKEKLKKLIKRARRAHIVAKKAGGGMIVEWKSNVTRRRMGKRLLTLVAERKKFRDIARKIEAPTHIVKEGNIL